MRRNTKATLAGNLMILAMMGASGCGNSDQQVYPRSGLPGGFSAGSSSAGLAKVRVKVDFSPALLVPKVSAKSVEDTVTKLEIHVTDPNTLEEELDPVIVSYGGTPGQIVDISVPEGTTTDHIDIRALDEDEDEVGDGDTNVNSSDEFSPRTDTNPLTVTIDTPNFNDQGAWIPQGPGPLFDNSGEQQADVSGRASSLASDPANTDILYLGTATSGVWKSSNGGNTWAPLTDAQTSLAVGALTLTGSNNLLVGTGESNSNGFYGDGILVSSDAGATFNRLNPGNVFTNKAFSRLVVNPANANQIFAGVYPAAGSNFAGSYITSDGNVGVFRSLDGGATFSNAFATTFGANPNLPCTDLQVENDGSAIYAGVDGAAAGDPSKSGVYRSLDNGASWTKLSLPGVTNASRVRLALAPNGGGSVLYALVGDQQGDAFLGLFVSSDKGNTWFSVTSNPTLQATIGKQSNYNNSLAIDPITPTTVYAGGTAPGRISGINLASGAAASIVRLQNSVSRSDRVHPHVDYQYFQTLNVGGKTQLRVATDGGIWQLDDAANAISTTPWVNLNGNQATGRLESLQPYGLSVNPKKSTQIAIGMQDNGSAVTDGNRRWLEPQGGDGALSRIDPVDPATVYLASANTGSGIGLSRYSDGGINSNNSVAITTGINLQDPAEFVTPFVIHPMQNQRLALGTNQIYETTNRGDQWTAVSGGILAPGATVTCLAYHGKNAAILYAGLTGGRVFARLPGGANFSGSTLPGGKRVTALAVDEDDATGRTAYASCATFTGAKVFRTTDAGATWTDFSQGLPDSPVMSLAFDSSIKPGRLYCGTDTAGVWVRPDNGASFSRFGQGLLPIQVTGLEISGRVLSAATYGRGVYQIPITADQTRVNRFEIVGNPPQ